MLSPKWGISINPSKARERSTEEGAERRYKPEREFYETPSTRHDMDFANMNSEQQLLLHKTGFINILPWMEGRLMKPLPSLRSYTGN